MTPGVAADVVDIVALSAGISDTSVAATVSAGGYAGGCVTGFAVSAVVSHPC